MMQRTFHIVFLALQGLSAATGLSYNEINIVFYLFGVPLVLLFLADRILKKYVLTPALVISWIALLLWMPNFTGFCNWLFDASVVFLNSFGFVGWNYVVASVMVCVALPVVAFAVLLPFAFPKLFRRRSNRKAAAAVETI